MRAGVLLMAAVAARHRRRPRAAEPVGTTFPADFPVILDASLGVPVIGFGAAGRVKRTPVIFLHGNNDTPFPTACNPFGKHPRDGPVLRRPRLRAERALGARLPGRPVRPAGQPDEPLGRRALHGRPTSPTCGASSTRCSTTPARARSTSSATAWASRWRARGCARDHAFHLVRRFVAIDGPNHGIINCSPSPLNYCQLPALGGFTPDSAVCQEYGSPDTPFLRLPEPTADDTPGPTRYLVIRNADTSFVYFAAAGRRVPAGAGAGPRGQPARFLAAAPGCAARARST